MVISDSINHTFVNIGHLLMYIYIFKQMALSYSTKKCMNNQCCVNSLKLYRQYIFNLNFQYFKKA